MSFGSVLPFHIRICHYTCLDSYFHSSYSSFQIHIRSCFLCTWHPRLFSLHTQAAGGPSGTEDLPRVPSAPGEGHERQPPFQVTGWKPTRRLRVLTPGQGKRRGGQGPGHLLHAGREEFFAGFLKELLLRLGDQVPSNLGDENWGLKAGREKEASVGQRAGGRAATGLHPPAPGPGCLQSYFYLSSLLNNDNLTHGL